MKLEERMIEESRTNSFRPDIYPNCPTPSLMLDIHYVTMPYSQECGPIHSLK